MTKPLYIALSALDFARLVNGKEIEHEVDGHTVKLILSDIGFDVMQGRLDEAQIAAAPSPATWTRKQ